MPIVQAPIWPATSSCRRRVGRRWAGQHRGRQRVGSQPACTDRARPRADRPAFAVNHVVPRLDEEAFEVTLEARPAVVSFALGDPGDLLERARETGAKIIHQVHTVAQAREAAAQGVDAVIAQGSEAGGQGFAAGAGSLALTPQVVDAVAPIPVLLAGGVGDGRGLAAAMTLGAAGVNVGTRFLASVEAGASEAWKQLIVKSESEDTVRFDTWSSIMPASGYEVVPRVIRTDFVARWESQAGEAIEQAEQLRAEIMGLDPAGPPARGHAVTGQIAGLIHELLPAGEIVRRMVSEAERRSRRPRPRTPRPPP